MSVQDRVLVLAPLGRDGPLALRALQEAGLQAELCADLRGLCARIQEGAGAAMITEEVLAQGAGRQLSKLLEDQEPWSDFPLVICGMANHGLEALGNVTILERPLRIRTLISALRAALRARRRQYETRDLLRALEQSVRDRDQFLAMLGHELRNPLAAILTSSELLDRSAPDGVFGRERAVIGRQARNLARLLEDLLDVARVTSGKISLRKTDLELGEIVRRTVQGLERAARRQNVELLALQLDGAVLVHADALRMEQIVGNLLTNAIKYTPSGGRIEIHIGEEGGKALLRIRDTGVGIAPDILPRIFDLFTQAPDAIDRAQGGMGVGLTLVRRLVELHGGTVSAFSDGPGRGSTFEVRLPLAPAREEPADRRAAREQRPGSRRILLVEDNPDSREILQLALEQLGHHVTTCGDGLEGVDQAKGQHPDAMVVDLGLPGCDGYTVAREVRAALGRNVRLVALSGYGQADDRSRALAAGFDLFLTKPADLDAIERAIGPGPRAREESA